MIVEPEMGEDHIVSMVSNLCPRILLHRKWFYCHLAEDFKRVVPTSFASDDPLSVSQVLNIIFEGFLLKKFTRKLVKVRIIFTMVVIAIIKYHGNVCRG